MQNNRAMKGTLSPERLVLQAGMDFDVETEHLNRYVFVSRFANGKTVLDAACGSGYGAYLLAQSGAVVTGIDISGEAIEMASSKFNHERTKFVKGDVKALPFNAKSFDFVVSFETIEHIQKDEQEIFVAEVSRVIRDDGIFICSTPNAAFAGNTGCNPYHKHEMELKEFQGLIQSYFKYCRLARQRQTFANVVLVGDDSDCLVSDRSDIVIPDILDRDVGCADAAYYLMLASKQPLPEWQGSVLMTKTNPKIISLKEELERQVAAKDQWIGVLTEQKNMAEKTCAEAISIKAQ